jgi:hypothetical protein
MFWYYFSNSCKKYFCCCFSQNESLIKKTGRDDDWGIITETDGSSQITSLVGDPDVKTHHFIRRKSSESEKMDSPPKSSKSVQIDTTPSKTKDGWNMYKSTNLASVETEDEDHEHEKEEKNFGFKNENNGETEELQANL